MRLHDALSRLLFDSFAAHHFSAINTLRFGRLGVRRLRHAEIHLPPIYRPTFFPHPLLALAPGSVSPTSSARGGANTCAHVRCTCTRLADASEPCSYFGESPGWTTARGRVPVVIEWNGEYVRSTLASSAARPVEGAAAMRANSLFRFFARC